MTVSRLSPVHLGMDEAFGAILAADGFITPSSASIKATQLDLKQYRHTWDVSIPPPPTRAFAVGTGRTGMLPLSKVSVIAGIGGSMKTALLITLGLHIGAGIAWAGHVVDPGAVLLVSLEDDAAEIQRRCVATAIAEFSPAVHALLQQRVVMLAMPGVDGRLTTTKGGAPTRTSMADAIIAEVRAHEQVCGVPVRLVGIDHARLAVGGDLNDSEAVTAAMSALTHVAEQTGAAVVLLCHSPKSSIAPARTSDYGMADVLGSGAFVDNARFAAVMTALDDKERKDFGLDANTAKPFLAFRVVKSNYSESGRVVYLQKTPVPGWGVAYPNPVALQAPPTPAPGVSGLVAQRVVDFVKASPGRYTRTKLRDRAGKSGQLQASEREVLAALDKLLDDGRVREVSATDADIAQWGALRKRDLVLHAV